MTKNWYRITVAMAAAVVSACSAMTSLSTPTGGATVEITSSKQSSVPRKESFSTTSFGNYEFRVQVPGSEPFCGYLPLKFNGGYLALDILLFAPAMFFNLREVYPYYDFDLERRVVKYRYSERDEWNTYVPLKAEVEDAKRIFEHMDSARPGK